MPTRRQVVHVLVGLVVVGAALLAIRLGALERAGPAHMGLSIGDGIPATVYVPEEGDDGVVPYQRPRGERPPVVVIAHGYSADRAIMSPLARSLARAGYAAVTFDFRGHGSNTERFAGELADDVRAVVDWAEASPLVDGERIAVLGHSMGAGAVLELGTRDARPVAVIPVSGGWAVYDEVLPADVLLLVAEDDPARIAERQAEVAADLRDRGARVVAREVAGTDHLTILYSSAAVRETVDFLDEVMGVDRTGPTPGLDDPRLRVAAAYLVLVVLLLGLIGAATGHLARPPGAAGPAPSPPVGTTVGGLVLLAGSLALTAPLMAGGGFDVLPLGAGQPVVVQTLLAAAALWGLRALVVRGTVGGRLATWVGEVPWLPLRSAALPGLGAGLAVFAVFTPLAGVVHRLVPTPERLVLWAIVTLMALPFFAAFEALVRRGGTWQAIGWGVLGRLVLLAAIVVGLGAGVLPQVIGLVVPLLAVQYLLLEVFAATCYARGRSPAVIAVAESVVIAWVVVTFTPIG